MLLQQCCCVQIGRVISDSVDEWESREGVALSLCYLIPLLNGETLEIFIDIIVPKGLDDRNAKVRSIMLRAATTAITEVSSVSGVDYMFL